MTAKLEDSWEGPSIVVKKKLSAVDYQIEQEYGKPNESQTLHKSCYISLNFNAQLFRFI